MPTPIKVHAEVYHPERDDEVDGMSATRWEFTLNGDDGKDYKFLVDLPLAGIEDRTVDVWLLGATVEVGDTPADGFASFTPDAQV